MFNPHPPLAAFPFTLLLIAWAAELLAYFRHPTACRSFARVLFLLSCAITPLTYLSGYWGAEVASQTFEIKPELIAAHQAWGKTLLIALIPTLLFAVLLRSDEVQAWVRPAYLLLLTLCLVLAIAASFYGGELVFRHGAGVFALTP